MSSHNESIIREPLITGKNITYAQITEDILRPGRKITWKSLVYRVFRCLDGVLPCGCSR